MKSGFIAIVLGIIALEAFKVDSQRATEAPQPHILLIMADDLGQETLGIYGSDSYQTPNLDRLAREGMRFDQCYATPLCTPSRVQLMTGVYNHRNYVGFGILDPTEKTFAHHLKEAGYKTFVAGKWQLLGNAHQRELAGGQIGARPEDAGFDDYCLWQVDARGSRYKDPLLTMTGDSTVLFEGGYGPDVFVRSIQRFMAENSDGPMFIYYPMVLTHDPFVPTPENPQFKDFDSGTKVNDTTYFGEMVGYTDRLIGEIVQTVDDLGIRDNTLFLFIGDNGTDRDVVSVRNGQKIRGDKGFTTNAGTRVPFIANWKNHIVPGAVNENLIDFTDFLPTLLDAAGTVAPQANKGDGLSFYPQLLGDGATTRDWIFCHYDPRWGEFASRRYVQDRTWKLYDNGEFYNLVEDPLEKNPLPTEGQSPEVVTLAHRFRSVLERYKKP